MIISSIIIMINIDDFIIVYDLMKCMGVLEVTTSQKY